MFHVCNPRNLLTNANIMSTLTGFRADSLNSCKAQSETSSAQFKELKTELKCLISQVAELKAKNSKLHDEVDNLKNTKLHTLNPLIPYLQLLKLFLKF